MSLPDFVGLVGVAAYLAAYALLQTERLRAHDRAYLALNGAGALLVIVSLIYSFNLPSFVTQLLWLGLTLVGFIRSRTRGNQARP